MSESVKIKRIELQKAREDKALEVFKSALDSSKELAVTAIQNTAISIVLMVALVEFLARRGYINDTERALLVSTGLVTEVVKSIDLGSLAKLIALPK